MRGARLWHQLQHAAMRPGRRAGPVSRFHRAFSVLQHDIGAWADRVHRGGPSRTLAMPGTQRCFSKVKQVFVCNSCGGEHAKWAGQCSFCKEWNTLSSFRPTATSNSNAPRAKKAPSRSWRAGVADEAAVFTPITQVKDRHHHRIRLESAELVSIASGTL